MPGASLLTIDIRTAFEGLHCWPTAPSQVAFLRNLHRHKFNISVSIPVGHHDRDLEFFMVKDRIDRFLRAIGSPYQGSPTLRDLGGSSCELIATQIGWHLLAVYAQITDVTVTVREDDENAGTVSLKQGPR